MDMNFLHINIKEEVDIKEELLDSTEEYLKNEDDDEQLDTSIERKFFPDNEINFSAENIKIEELDQEVSVKSELRELKDESILDEEIFINDGIISENLMTGEESSTQHSFSDNETNFSAENIKIEELDEKTSEKSELSELENESILDESSTQDALVGNSGEGEKIFKMKSTRGRPKTSAIQKIKELGKKFKCPHCSYESNNKANFECHLSNHSNIKLFKCSECNYECNQKVYLKRHKLRHVNIKLFKCSECKYECNHKGSLKIHTLNKHSHLKLFKCSECNYECNKKDNLSKHMLNMHSNIKLFNCPECNYECNQKVNLKTHMLGHRNIKLFRCSECNHECNEKSNLKRHMLNKHSNIKLFNCSECDYECNDKGRLKTHMLRHENINTPTDNCRGATRRTWSEREKREIFWCVTYARHGSFPSKNTSKRVKQMMLERGIMDKEKIENTPDKRFSRITMNLKIGKTSLTKEEMEQIEIEVDEFVRLNVQNHEGEDSNGGEWTLSRNVYLMESYYIGELIPTKTKKDELWKYVVENKEFDANDYMDYRFGKKFENIDRRKMLKQKSCILGYAKDRNATGNRKIKSTYPTKEDLDKIKMKAKSIVENEMEMTVEIIEDIKKHTNERMKRKKKREQRPIKFKKGLNISKNETGVRYEQDEGIINDETEVGMSDSESFNTDNTLEELDPDMERENIIEVRDVPLQENECTEEEMK